MMPLLLWQIKFFAVCVLSVCVCVWEIQTVVSDAGMISIHVSVWMLWVDLPDSDDLLYTVAGARAAMLVLAAAINLVWL